MSKEPESEPVIKLPRGRGLRLSGPELFRIALTVAMLIAVVVLTKPCSNAVSTFVMGMDGSGQSAAVRKPGTVEPPPHPVSGSGRTPVGAALPTDEGEDPDDDFVSPAKLDDRFERLRPGMTEAEVRSAVERAKAKASPASKPADHGLE